MDKNEIFTTPEQTFKFVNKTFVKMIRTKEGFQELVKYMGTFPYYGIENCILIKIQKPDATNVASMSLWNFRGRGVTDGGKALRVLIPIMEDTYRTNKDGVIEKTGFQKIAGYKYGFAWDESQTTGKTLNKRILTKENAEEIYPIFKNKINKEVIPLFRIHEVDNVEFAEIKYNQLDIFINKNLDYIDKINALIDMTAICCAKYKADRTIKGLYEDRIIGLSQYEAWIIAYATKYALGLKPADIQLVPHFEGMRDELANEFKYNFSRMKKRMNSILDVFNDAYDMLYR